MAPLIVNVVPPLALVIPMNLLKSLSDNVSLYDMGWWLSMQTTFFLS